MGAGSWAWRRGQLGPAAGEGEQWAQVVAQATLSFAAASPHSNLLNIHNPICWPKLQFGPGDEANAVRAGWLPASAARYQTVDRATGKPLAGLNRGSVNWNARRGRYVAIAVQVGGQDQVAIGGGPSKFGELFYCEAPTITGPWRACDRIITHDVTGASCYNPLQLPWLDEDGGNVLYIACTWTSMSSGGDGPNDRACDYDMYGGQHCAVAVPRYEYNNVVFRLNVTRDLPHLPHLAQE
jgi:hypothetical protein